MHVALQEQELSTLTLGADASRCAHSPGQQLPVLSPQSQGWVWLLGWMPSLQRNWEQQEEPSNEQCVQGREKTAGCGVGCAALVWEEQEA